MSTIIHTLHIILAGTWLGGVVFTMTVVSPALKAMKWSEAERISVRSTIGKQYARAERQPRAARDLRRSGRGF